MILMHVKNLGQDLVQIKPSIKLPYLINNPMREALLILMLKTQSSKRVNDSFTIRHGRAKDSTQIITLNLVP